MMRYFRIQLSLKFFVNLKFVYKIMSDGKKIGSEENQNNSPKKRTPNKKDSPNSKEKEAPKKPSVKKETVKEEQTSSH